MTREPNVVRPWDAVAAPPTPGMERRTVFEEGGTWAGWVRTDAGVAGGWHHHGGHESFIFIIRGALSIDYGPGGHRSIRASAGDFVFNPANVVHRETTSPAGEVEAFVVRVGDGPLLVNVDGPDPG
jgi:uncharacterized RmlC-like cupin family protein